MRTLPLIFQTSEYKYTIIARLATLQGAESKMKKRKTELINYLIRQGCSETSLNRWLTIKIKERTEIPNAVLLHVKDWFNRKYSEQNTVGKITVIQLEDLFHPEFKNHRSVKNP